MATGGGPSEGSSQGLRVTELVDLDNPQRLGLRLTGARRTIDIAKHLFKTSLVTTLTLYLLSTENWRRPQDEINTIMALLEESIGEFGAFLIDNNIRVELIGQVRS